MINALVSAIELAAVYIIGGLSWVILFRSTKVLNFATGQFMAIGAYFYFIINSDFHLTFLVSLVGAIIWTGLVGALLQLGVFARLLGARAHAVGHSPFSPVILTFAVGIIAASIIDMTFGANVEYQPDPFHYGVIHLPGSSVITPQDIFTWIIAILAFVTTATVLRYTKSGIQMRAAAEQPLLASQSGINVPLVFIVAWGVACALAALAGISYGFESSLTPDIENVGLLTIAPVMVGGMDSIKGVIPGAFIVAIAQNLFVLQFGATARDAAVMFIILAVLAIRPNGLFGTGDVRRL
jgi:branched-chain amino acid transport system permease protein